MCALFDFVNIIPIGSAKRQWIARPPHPRTWGRERALPLGAPIEFIHRVLVEQTVEPDVKHSLKQELVVTGFGKQCQRCMQFFRIFITEDRAGTRTCQPLQHANAFPIAAAQYRR